MSTTQPEALGARTPTARAEFEKLSKFCGCEWSLDWDTAGFYSDVQADAAFIWFERGFQCTNPAPVQAAAVQSVLL